MARGDQIYVIRQWLKFEGVYEHHGIDCGDGTVIHYRKPSETVERTSLMTFSKGQPCRRKQYPTHFIPNVVVERAIARLGEQKYNLLFNNCEHFATWCTTGISHSQQVKTFVPWITTLDNPVNLEVPLDEALHNTEYHKAKVMLDRALQQIKVVWDDVQPRYIQAQQESDSWQNVAQEALRLNREDLARAALTRKRNYQKTAEKLDTELQKLATMTETLLRNSLHLEQS